MSHSTLLQLFLICSALGGCATVRPNEGGVVFRPFRHDEPTRVLNPGTYWVGPFAHVSSYDLRLTTAEEKIEAQTLDRIHVVATADITYQLGEQFLADVDRGVGPNYYDAVIKPRIVSEIREQIATVNHDALGVEAIAIQDAIGKEIAAELLDLGIVTRAISIVDVDYPPAIETAIAERMAKEQDLRTQATRLDLAEGEAAIKAAEARGASEAKLASKEAELAMAKKDAEISEVRAKAAADAAAQQSRGLSESYLQLRTIEAFQAMATNPATKLYFVPLGKDGLPTMWLPDAR